MTGIGKLDLNHSLAGLAPNAVVGLLDLSTEELVDIDSGPICIQSGIVLSFECVIRNADRGIWNITWLINDMIVQTTTLDETTDPGELVNVSSRFDLKRNSRYDFPKMNLSCRATAPSGESLKITAALESCFGKELRQLREDS